MAQPTHVVNSSVRAAPSPQNTAPTAGTSATPAPVDAQATADSTAIIQVIARAALNPEVDIDKMERLLQMQERVLDRQAMMAYSAAMAAMQTDVLCALLNITTRGQDDNGNKAGSIKSVTPFQAGQIQRLISQCPATTQEWFSGKYGAAVQVPQADFDKLRASLSKRAVQ